MGGPGPSKFESPVNIAFAMLTKWKQLVDGADAVAPPGELRESRESRAHAPGGFCTCGCAWVNPLVFGTHSTAAEVSAAIEAYKRSEDLSVLVELADVEVAAKVVDSVFWPSLKRLSKMAPSVVVLWACIAAHTPRGGAVRATLLECVRRFPHRGWEGSLPAALAATPANSRGAPYARNGLPHKQHEVLAALAFAKETGELGDLAACADVRIAAFPDYYAACQRDDFLAAPGLLGPKQSQGVPLIAIANLTHLALYANPPETRMFLGQRLVEIMRARK